MPAPSDTSWNAMVQTAAYEERRQVQLERDRGKKKGPPAGYEAAELQRLRQLLRDLFGLTR